MPFDDWTLRGVFLFSFFLNWPFLTAGMVMYFYIRHILKMELWTKVFLEGMIFNERHYLTVIQVMFINRRQGNMTKLLDILKIIKETYKLNRIMIQSPLNEAMRNWCRKNEFIQNKSDESEYIMI
jgi:hypothetical protein